MKQGLAAGAIALVIYVLTLAPGLNGTMWSVATVTEVQSAGTLRRANAVHAIAALQTE